MSESPNHPPSPDDESAPDDDSPQEEEDLAEFLDEPGEESGGELDDESGVIGVPIHRAHVRPIPEELYLCYEDEPPSRCLICAGNLRDGRLYQIQRVFRGTEVILEMTVCHECGAKMSEEFSEASLETIREFLTQKLQPDADGSSCHACGTARADLPGFTLVGLCQGGSILAPMAVLCEPCNMALEERLSKKTRDVQRDFVRDHFPGVPADLDPSPLGVI